MYILTNCINILNYIVILFIERKKKRLNIWSKDLVYEKTFWLLSHTPGYSVKSCPGQCHKVLVFCLMKQSIWTILHIFFEPTNNFIKFVIWKFIWIWKFSMRSYLNQEIVFLFLSIMLIKVSLDNLSQVDLAINIKKIALKN